jgi:hypothetical protein
VARGRLLYAPNSVHNRAHKGPSDVVMGFLCTLILECKGQACDRAAGVVIQ